MKKLFYTLLFAIILFIGNSCSKTEFYIDDVYYHPKQEKVQNKQSYAVLDTVSPGQDYQNYNTDDYSYTLRLKRFYSPYYGFNYYDDYYTNLYWYTYNPFYLGYTYNRYRFSPYYYNNSYKMYHHEHNYNYCYRNNVRSVYKPIRDIQPIHNPQRINQRNQQNIQSQRNQSRVKTYYTPAYREPQSSRSYSVPQQRSTTPRNNVQQQQRSVSPQTTRSFQSPSRSGSNTSNTGRHR